MNSNANPEQKKTLTLKLNLNQKQKQQILLKVGITPPPPPTPEEIKKQKEEKAKAHEERNVNGKAQRYLKTQNTINWLCEKFPDAFSSENPKPLKIGILEDLFTYMESCEDPVQPTRKNIREALNLYTYGPRYFHAILKSEHRYNLLGTSIQEIEEVHKKDAQKNLDLWKQKKYGNKRG